MPRTRNIPVTEKIERLIHILEKLYPDLDKTNSEQLEAFVGNLYADEAKSHPYVIVHLKNLNILVAINPLHGQKTFVYHLDHLEFDPFFPVTKPQINKSS
jgi:hypothetical protein